MAGKNRKLLQIHHKAIVQDLDVMDILDDLLAKQAITSEDFEYIANLDKADRVYKTRYLLKLISQSNNSAYETFVDTLEENHVWLWKLLTVDSDMGSFEDSLSRGDVPRLPDHFVKRSFLEKQLLSKLRQLTRHNILVLHGMSGCGKTTLALSVLRTNSELITSDFNGIVYWLNLGNCKTVDDVIAQQNKLYRKASLNTSFMNSSISMSSIGSNADSLSNYDFTWHDLKDKLKTLFAEQPLKDGLLVLDEVNEKICVEGFDIGCKILVTTRDNNVVTNFHPQIVKIENHFSEEESLALFASCLEVDVKNLPRQAKKLHEICKGSPFHIALIGAELAENKERLVHDTRRWNYYINKLEKKEFIFNFSRSDVNPMKTVEFCINSLKPDLLKLFKMLAILPDNVKLSANVLSKLWNKTTIEIDTIIQQLRSKSLIIVFYDEDKHDYTYEIHDLIMGYLRSSSNEDDIKKLHGGLLTSYNYGIDYCPIEIEDDGYIALYVGYHLAHTKNLNNMWKLFKTLYLNLKFLGNKVRLTGPADVILDLQKYENYIVNDDIDKALLYNIKEYLSTHGIDLYRYPCTDIIQSILQNESKGILYMKAWETAQERCCLNELYFEFLHEQNVEEIKYSTIDVKEPIKSVCFLGDYVLVGTKTGVIKLFHISTNKLKKELHTTDTGEAGITWVGACPANPPVVAALDARGTVRVWYVDDVYRACDGVIEEEAEETHNNNFPSSVTIALANMPFLNCRWSNFDETLITHTLHVIYVYNTNGDIKYCISETYKDIQISCCVPSNCENTVLVATNKSLDILNLKTGEKQSFDDSGHVLDIVIVPGTNKVITLKEKQVMQYEYKMLRRFNRDCSDRECKEIITSDAVKENISFISIAVNKSGSLLFISTNDGRVICVDLKSYVHVLDLENRRGNVVSMSVSEVAWDELEAGPDVLLTGTDDAENSAKVWYLDAYAALNRQRDNGKVRLTTKFDASFINALYPPTPTPSTVTTTSTVIQSTPSTPKRHQSFVNTKTKEKRNVMRATMSLDRHSLKPLNLKGITNGNGNVDSVMYPLLAIVDDRNNVKVMRGRKLITEIQPPSDDQITKVKISPCNQYIVCGLKSGIVRKFTIRTKEYKDIMNVNSPVNYMNFVNSDLLMVAGKNRCLMAYMLMENGEWKPEMLEKGNANLGSQEILNDIQGIKKKSSQSEIHSSESDSSISSKERLFKNCDRKSLCESSGLIDCYWIPNLGLVTIKCNATIKLWDEKLKLTTILNARQMDVCITCTAFQNNVLVICDEYSKCFQSFELKTSERVYLDLIQEYTLNYKITSCALTDDGNILAMGLDTGDIVIWHIQNKKQLKLLRHHKSKVNWCGFSPTPDRLYRSTVQSPSTLAPQYLYEDEDQPPLVLVTMASEIVWWNITYVIRTRRRGLRAGQNVITPLASPLDTRSESHQVDNSIADSRSNCFFGSNPFDPKQYWKINWKRKTCKEGSKRKEILACIKLTGMSAKQIFIDEKFSSFITVDNPGHIHIMKLMGSCAS